MHCISISYKTAPLFIRQQFSFSKEEKLAFEKYLLQNTSVKGCVILSTCNRSEIYFSGDKSAFTEVENGAAEFKHLNEKDIRKYFLHYSEKRAISHLFQVSSGLDSMVIGEDEILRQIKESYQASLSNRNTNQEINIAFHHAIRNAKRVKTDTKISSTPVSIGTLTVHEIINFVKQKQVTILIVGASGKIGSIVVKNLSNKTGLNIIVTTRNHNKDKVLFEHYNNVTSIDYNDRYQYIKEAQVIVSATTSPHYTFTYQEVESVLGDSPSKKLWIDLAVPCDIDKDILLIPGMRRLDIDTFEQISKENNRLKLEESYKAEIILNHLVEETQKEIYFQEFQCHKDKLAQVTEENGVSYLLYKLKETLSDDELKSVLTSFESLIGEME